MNPAKSPYRFLFAGGGTGGHLFPAVAVAQKIKMLVPDADILFIGTKSKIEGRVVPELGFKFKSIWIQGFSRRLTWNNLLFPLKVIVSLVQSFIINMSFRPKVAIGSGGYVSGPAVFAASKSGAKVLLLEQNSFPGVTTRLLEKYADEIHISFESTTKYFKHNKNIYCTGNPVRESLTSFNRKEALKTYNIDNGRKTLLVLGGSLGAASINEAVAFLVKKNENGSFNVIWQTGKNYYEKYRSLASENVIISPFISDMNKAYSASDLVIARAGATTIAELLVLGLPAVLVPSPNVAGNHQYYNAKSLADKNAAVLIDDKLVLSVIYDTVADIINDDKRLAELSRNAKSLSRPDAADIIARNAVQLAEAGR